MTLGVCIVILGVVDIAVVGLHIHAHVYRGIRDGYTYSSCSFVVPVFVR